MTDIVERLKGGVYGTNRIPLCFEAAAEIERLRTLLKRARSMMYAVGCTPENIRQDRADAATLQIDIDAALDA